MTYGLAALMGIAPAMILMYAVLRKYTYPAVEKPFFSDPSFFGLFVVGMISGTILFAVYTYFPVNLFVKAISFAILECMILLVVLNLKRFHGKSDTVFYGYGLGLGFGATMSMGMIYFVMVNTGDNLVASGYLILMIYAISKTLILSAIGLTIGEGIAKLRLMEFTAQAIMVNMVYQIVMVQWFRYPEEWSGYLALILGLVIALAYFYKTAFVNLPNVIRMVLRQEGKKRNDIPK